MLIPEETPVLLACWKGTASAVELTVLDLTTLIVSADIENNEQTM